MKLEIITPESKVFEGEAKAVLLPGIDGLFQVLNNHAPIVSALKAGKVKVDLDQDYKADEDSSPLVQTGSNSKIIEVEIKGGVAEMLNNKMIVLAE
ncbi:MAG: F0F1 ATP synthase subunit epsilon [Bacteroidetes bacterium]|nr:MAG: F0F1 ATP synthase subunit epsilon [Bacteroidota bacterium]